MDVTSVLKRTSWLRKGSFVLSCLAVLFGMIALFSNHWLEVGPSSSGFISVCAEGICMSVQKQLPENLRVAYVFGVIIMVFMPLIMMFAAMVIQGVTIWKGPCKRLDLSGTVCAWLSTYHGLLLLILVVAAAKMSQIPTLGGDDGGDIPQESNPWFSTTQPNGNFIMSGSNEYQGDSGSEMQWSVGWSAYLGLFALLFALASATLTCVYSGNDEKPQSDDNIPLDTDYA